jgi:methionyl-tRNA synthetase
MTVAETFYVTTPIYYVNDVPHIGHSYTTIAADVLARFWRAQGRDVRFLTGTDEHGIKIYKAAQEKGKEPDELGDEVVVHFQKLWEDLNITHDDFIRTTEDRHEQRVQALIARLQERDEIYKGQYQGWYDEGQEEFVTESTARENEYKSAISGKPLTRYSEENYFFRLSKWVPKLIEYIEAHPGFVSPESRRNEVLSKLGQGVEDLCISRGAEKLPWGVPMPGDESHVVYVWVDALSNYITALGMPEIGRDDDGAFARYWPADVHLIGKDILWFHAVYWPCLLMALDLPLPRCVFAHGWWTAEGRKMSKTLGNFISRETIAEICSQYSVDVYRYYLLRAVAFGSDGDFSQEMFQSRYNSDLANTIGNLLSRTVNMITRYLDGVVPSGGTSVQEQAAVIEAAEALSSGAPEDMASCSFHRYIERIIALADATNQFIDKTEPFKLAKDPSRKEALGEILYTCAESLRIVLLYLEPIMPEAARRGWAQLGVGPEESGLSQRGQWGRLEPGTHVKKGDALFPRKQ